jgi:hypothetical protein
MKLTNYFEISRFWMLLKMELYKGRNAILMGFVLMFGLLFFVGLLLDIIVEKEKVTYEFTEYYASSLILGGCIFSSLAFNDLSSTLKRYQYLTLPVSTFEKFLCMWLLTSVGWIIVFTIAFTLYTVVGIAMGRLLFSHITFLAFDPLGEFSLESVKYYLISQSIFLVGAAHFKGYVFPKTLLTLIIVGAVSATFIYFIMKDVFLTEHACAGDECELVNELKVHQAWLFIKWLFWWVLAPVCWVTTYLGLKEQEV